MLSSELIHIKYGNNALLGSYEYETNIITYADDTLRNSSDHLSSWFERELKIIERWCALAYSYTRESHSCKDIPFPCSRSDAYHNETMCWSYLVV